MIMGTRNAADSLVFDNDAALWRTSADLVGRVCNAIRPRRFRTMRQWAEQEFVLPEGDYLGTRFRAEVQPAHALWLDEVDSGNWLEHYLIAGAQGGKSVAAFLIPTLYHLFERGQTVICGVPLLDLVADKWLLELLPAIEQSRYRDLLPLTGAGSKGGVGNLVKFRNGSVLRFMTGGGSDKTRSSFTAPILVCTEAEGFGSISGSSDEKVTPLDQLRERSAAYGSRARRYFECTLTTESGVMWTAHQTGSGGTVVFPCVGCGSHIHPEREHLFGWQDAQSELKAKEATRWSCPNCGQLLQEEDRKRALRSAKIVHRGQRVETDGTIRGLKPETQNLTVRFGASANTFREPGLIGLDEWKIRYQMNQESGEAKARALNVWTYAIPAKDDAIVVDPLDVQRLLVRLGAHKRGFCPADTWLLTAGVDIRKTQLHWFVIAWTERGPRLVDFGIERVPSGDMPIRDAILSAGEAVQDIFLAGFPIEDSENSLSVSRVLADAGWQTDEVEELCSKDDAWLPSMGFGAGMLRDKKYTKPKSERSARIIGNGWHIAEVRGRLLVELNANQQKSALHKALTIEADSPHALLFCDASPQDLREMVYEITAEEQKDRWKPGVGVVTEWKQTRKRNHFLDAAYLAFSARVIHEELLKLLEKQEPEEVEWNPEVSGARGGIFG